MRSARLGQLIFLLMFLLVLPIFAQAPADYALTNADIVKMVKAGLPEDIIVREIQASRTNFGTSPSALIELKKQGASEKILGAVLDSRMGTGTPGPESQVTPRIAAQAAAPGVHHMPSFQADLRINPTINGKLSMSHNQVKFERAGVPLFSLKWKELKNTSSTK
jgi:hypothetical protein